VLRVEAKLTPFILCISHMVFESMQLKDNMPSVMPAATRIFEDADAEAKTSKTMKGHKRAPSVGEFLRGRKNKENDTSKVRAQTPIARGPEIPLGERHVNSPPQIQRVPLRDGSTRPTMHKKTKSNISLKSLVRDKSSDSGSISSSEGRMENHKPKKSKSSTNLAALFKKKSRKNLKEEEPKGQENVTPPSSANVETTRSPIWAQFATQPLEDKQGRVHHPPGKSRTVQEEIDLYTPKELAAYRPLQQDILPDNPVVAERPPPRPFLGHRSSRSSIFREELDGVPDTHPSQKPSQQSALGEAQPRLESHPSNHHQPPETNNKRTSRVMDAIGTLNLRSQKQAISTPKYQEENSRPMSEDEINSALESLLDARNIALNMRNQMRALDNSMKLKLIQNQRGGSGSSTSSNTPNTTDKDRKDRSRHRPTSRDEEDPKEAKRSRSRPRSRAFTLTRRDDGGSPTKKQRAEESTRSRSKTRPKSADVSLMRPGSSRSLKSSTSISSLFSSKPDTAAVPGDFIHYLREVGKPELVEIGKMHKLRILLRNESIAWTDMFVKSGGMDEVVNLLYRIIQVEWREEHEDTLLHETLLCLKGLCTTSLALQRLAEIEAVLFPKLLSMLFDEEKKGPSEFSTRSIVISLLFAHLSASLHTDEAALVSRARIIFSYLKDPTPEEAKKPFDFIEQMHVSRPYRVWCKEVVNVTKEVFWIFLHHLNVIPIINTDQNNSTDLSKTYTDRHFPPPRPPHPAAPYVGGVEWEATSYLAIHLDLLNGLLASLPTKGERNSIREEMRASGWEKAMGGTMRTCKEKFYGGVHEGLKVWVAAAREDGWAVEDVRAGPPREASSPRKASPVKKKVEEAPRLRLDVGVGVGIGGQAVGGAVGDGLGKVNDGWI
jgi:Diaphanous GTPase-binding Domain